MNVVAASWVAVASKRTDGSVIRPGGRLAKCAGADGHVAFAGNVAEDGLRADSHVVAACTCGKCLATDGNSAATGISVASETAQICNVVDSATKN